MGSVDIKTPAAKNHAATAAAATSSRTAAKSASTAESSALLPGIIEALLHFVGAHRIERISGIARHRHRFRRAILRGPWNRHTRRRYVSHRTASGILPRFTLKHRKVLKSAPASIRLSLRFVRNLMRPRQEYQLKIRQHIWMARIQFHLARAGRECRHLYSHAIVSISQNAQRITAVDIRRGIDLFLRGRIRGRNSSTRNRHIPRFHNAMNYPDPYCRWNRLSPQKLGVKHNTMK